MMRPGVTVCIPVFNDSVLAHYAVQSVEAVADEILVFQDAGSSDSYWLRFCDYCAGIKKVRIIIGETHEGFTCRNHMIRAASYSILHFMDADDILISEATTTYEDAIRLAENQKCALCLRLQELHGDIHHVPRNNIQLYDTTHSIAYNSPNLSFSKRCGPFNPLGYENLYGVPFYTYPERHKLNEIEALDYKNYDGKLISPMIIHLAGIKENRLQVYRAIAYRYQELQVRHNIDQYIENRAQKQGLPVEEFIEREAIVYLNSYGAGIPISSIELSVSLPLTLFSGVAECARANGYIIRRDDRGWRRLYLL